uniref:GAF domain-containing protein n=2 Tax=Lygus hesperus TaxID=30085 RepID=A0A0K8T459_LYGHE
MIELSAVEQLRGGYLHQSSNHNINLPIGSTMSMVTRDLASFKSLEKRPDNKNYNSSFEVSGLSMMREPLDSKVFESKLIDPLKKGRASMKQRYRNEWNDILKAAAPFVYLRRTESLQSTKDLVKMTKKSFKCIKLHRNNFEIPTLSNYVNSGNIPFYLLDVGITLKKCTRSKNMALYLRDGRKGELFQYAQHIVSSSHRVNFKIKPGTRLAAYVGHTKEYIVTDDCGGDPRFPLGCGWKNSTSRPALCVPLVTPDTLELYGVLEFTKGMMDPPYTKRSVEACLNLVAAVSMSLQEDHESVITDRTGSLFDYLTQLIGIFFCEPLGLNRFFSELVVSARIALRAQTSVFYTSANIDDLGGIELNMFMESGKSERHRKKRWLSLRRSRTVAAKVVMTRQICSLGRRELLEHDYNVNIYRPVPCHSVLSVPIYFNQRVIGVVELLNKLDEEKFSKADEKLMERIQTFYDITLSAFVMKEDMKRLLARMEVTKNMLQFHMQPCPHEYEILHNTSLDIPREINTLYFQPTNYGTHELLILAKAIIKNVLGMRYLKLVNINKLLLMVAKTMPDHPFHNFAHCFSTFHIIAFIISQDKNFFTFSEKEDMLFTALCHGAEKKQMIQTTAESEAIVQTRKEWKTFNINETMIYIEIILKVCGVLPPTEEFEEYRIKLRNIQEIMIECYQKSYVQDGMELVERLMSAEFKWNHPVDRQRMLKTCMLVASYHIHYNHFIPSVSALLSLLDEMKREVMLLKQHDPNSKALEEIPFNVEENNRNLREIAKEQVAFLDSRVLPWVEILNTLFPTTSAIYFNCIDMKKSWEDLLTLKTEETWFPDVSTVLQDSDARDTVLKIVEALEESDRKDDSTGGISRVKRSHY